MFWSEAAVSICGDGNHNAQNEVNVHWIPIQAIDKTLRTLKPTGNYCRMLPGCNLGFPHLLGNQRVQVVSTVRISLQILRISN